MNKHVESWSNVLHFGTMPTWHDPSKAQHQCRFRNAVTQLPGPVNDTQQSSPPKYVSPVDSFGMHLPPAGLPSCSPSHLSCWL